MQLETQEENSYAALPPHSYDRPMFTEGILVSLLRMIEDVICLEEDEQKSYITVNTLPYRDMDHRRIVASLLYDIRQCVQG